ALVQLDSNSWLTLTHVRVAEGLEVVRQMFRAEVERIEKALAEDADRQLKSLAAKYEAILHQEVATRLSQGRPEAEIVEVAASISADLIVMGAQGRATVGRHIFGGTIERVLQRADCSVLAVRQPVKGP